MALRAEIIIFSIIYKFSLKYRSVLHMDCNELIFYLKTFQPICAVFWFYQELIQYVHLIFYYNSFFSHIALFKSIVFIFTWYRKHLLNFSPLPCNTEKEEALTWICQFFIGSVVVIQFYALFCLLWKIDTASIFALLVLFFASLTHAYSGSLPTCFSGFNSPAISRYKLRWFGL